MQTYLHNVCFFEEDQRILVAAYLLRLHAAHFRYAQAELIHGRFAMLGVAGMLLPEVVADLGVKWPGAGVKWYDAGAFDGYFAPVSVIFAIQFFLMGWAEMRR